MKKLIFKFKTFVPRSFAYLSKTHLNSSFVRGRMKLRMIVSAFTKQKVFNSIIIANMVNMVNRFLGRQISSNVLFHKIAMLFHSSMSITKGVVRNINMTISLMIGYFLKEFVIFSFFKRLFVGFHKSLSSCVPCFVSFFKLILNTKRFSLHCDGITGLRAIDSFFSRTLLNIKFFFTYRANLKNSRLSHGCLLFLVIVSYMCIVSTPVAYCTQWRNGTGEETILGSESVSDIDIRSFQDIVDPLDRLLAVHRQGARLDYVSVASVSVSAGEVTVSNADGSIRLFVRNTSATTVTWADIDAGGEAASTTYYVYAYAVNATDAGFSVIISTNSTTPTGATYYKKIGSFYNNSGSNIDQDKIFNEPFGPVMANSAGNPPITAIYNYATSTSSFTSKTGDLKVVYGQGTNPFTITNLPFTATSSYSISCSMQGSAGQTQNMFITAKSASSFTCSDGLGNGKTTDWIAVGY